MTDKNIEELRTILTHYGKQGQVMKLREELSELIEAIDDVGKVDTGLTRAHFIEELADVSIMVEQMKLALNLGEQQEYYKMINFKIQRQLGRIRKEQNDDESP